MQLTDRDRTILKQVAFKAAIDVVPLAEEAYFTVLKEYAEAFEEILLQLHDVPDNVVPITSAPSATVTPEEAAATVAAGFPGSTVVAAAPAVTESSNTETLWQNLIVGQPHGRVNTAEWYDNRTSKKNPNGPDFKHKATGKGLWLTGKYPAPGFVTEHFA